MDGCLEIIRFRTPDMVKQRHRRNSKPARDPALAGTSRLRQCLMCGTGFTSAWSGERICQPCKTKTVWRTGVRWPSGPIGAKG